VSYSFANFRVDVLARPAAQRPARRARRCLAWRPPPQRPWRAERAGLRARGRTGAWGAWGSTSFRRSSARARRVASAGWVADGWSHRRWFKTGWWDELPEPTQHADTRHIRW